MPIISTNAPNDHAPKNCVRRAVLILADADAVSAEVFSRVNRCAAAAIAKRGHFALAIPGGSILKMLANTKPLWAAQTTVAYVNHKAVSMGDSKLATHSKARALFLDAWTGADVLVLNGGSDSTLEAKAYESQIRSKMASGEIPTSANGLPAFDMMLIGVGDDGHVGSLYPNREEVLEMHALVLPVAMKAPGSITLSLPVMKNASEMIIAACGVSDKYPQGKSAGMFRAIEGDETTTAFPCAGLRHCANWIIDEAAASKLSQAYRKRGA